MRLFRPTVLMLAILLPVPPPAIAQGLGEERIKELALEAIRENPRIIMEAVQLLEQEQAAIQAEAQVSALESQRQLLEQDPNAPVLGNPDGDVTVVEFFDYNCPYCRRAMSEVQGLLKADPDVRLVYREWPILNEGSVFAARAALAAREQGKYEDFHWALMRLNEPAIEASVLQVAMEIGLDLDKLRADMDAPEVQRHIDQSMRLAQALGFNGTPSFVIGDNLVPGYVEQKQLEELADEARRSD